MNLSDQVCDLEYAKKLKELGLQQQSLFSWMDMVWKKSLNQEVLERRWIIDESPKNLLDEFKDQWCSAFTATELGEILPFEIFEKWTDDFSNHYITQHRLYMQKVSDTEYNYYYQNGCEPELVEMEDVNEANCRARMLIYLIENKLVEVKDGKATANNRRDDIG